ncbi:hypothetical protein C2S53_006528 [Perilla frutescens var. hirtella]|uniref:Uncharacterized protein n=1 Tax=Perilla frutescens var. hirtella TaxID=608512 RepID=A0AAD4IY98_PERFH|nr:hypothetical protein C2S53_006528 [Perilla frutescens var. hirtella]
MMEGRKFAVRLCAKDSDYMKKMMYGGLHGIFVQMLKEDGKTWDAFKVTRGDFPADGEIGEHDGFVITESCSDAHGNDLWIGKLVVLLKKLDAMKEKILGICLDHQQTVFADYQYTEGMKTKSLMVRRACMARLEMTWRDTENNNDCSVYAMRHMETYMEQSVNAWKCNLEKGNVWQMNVLLIKYCGSILSSV